ncbi:hypothetical protein [Paraglaciecola chathamensis]|uniref:Uncharacterized protein n=1 Tax=Paraglaciecola chathamensis S18K6 TaxID=1127672 RepID=A0AAV3UV38_9ALTE|nr:hypothetical protein [Paraglaciecola chathamensis]GAC08917.1 hypothetical protein GCHA_0955 [Paraglaciecola chathamensis S18K6]
MYLFNFYFSIGLFSAFVFVGYWWLYKDRVDIPASLNLMLIRATAYIFVWPVLFWKWFKSEAKTRFITEPEFVMPEPRPVDPNIVKNSARDAEREAQTLHQEWLSFVDTLPQCGSHIMYKGTDIYGERLDGRFIFETVDLLPLVFDKLNPKPVSFDDTDSANDSPDAEREASDGEAEIDSQTSSWVNTPSLPNTQEHYIHRWLRTYDPALFVCNVVPTSFDRFEYIAADMIEAGKGQVHCKSCDTVYDASDIKAVDGGQGGWILGELYCPNDHLLARRKKIHFMRPRGN